MENEISNYSPVGPEEGRKTRHANDAETIKDQEATPAKEQKVSRPPTARRERIRAYQKIDYWQ